MKYFLYCLLGLLLAPSLCLANQSLPFLYNRSAVTVIRAHPAPLPLLPWQTAPAEESNPAMVLDVEVRDAAALYNQQGWFNLAGLADNSGMLMIFRAPAATPLPASAQYAPLDILMIDAEGKITQIAPDIILAQLEQALVPDAPILAFMFLKGGTCKKLSISPGDRVEYALFKQQPELLKSGLPSKTPRSDK